MKILFASKNKNKFEEIREIFSESDFKIIFDDSLEDVVEDRDTTVSYTHLTLPTNREV